MSVPPYDSRETPPNWQQGTQTDPFGNAVSFTVSTGYGAPPPPRPRRPTGCLVGLILLFTCGLPLCILAFIGTLTGGAAVLASGLGLGDIASLLSGITEAIGGPATEAIVGDPTRFDPLVGLEQAQRFAGEGAIFAGMEAAYVRRDGTMDLTADYASGGDPTTTYYFLRPIDPPANAPPVGAGNSGGQWYEPITIEAYRPGAVRTRTSTGGGVSTRITYTNLGMTRDVDAPTTSTLNEPMPPVRCAFVKFWEAALDRGAPADAVARITYDTFGSTIQYDFSISGIVTLDFNENCELEE